MIKRALLIGCNYTATPSVQLSGCISDVVNMRNTLIDAYGYQDRNIFVLRDDDMSRLPTKANILNYLTQLVATSTANDMLWFHYSGHGTQIQNRNGDELDKMDECIVPCDYTTSGVIIDNEFHAILKNAKCRMMILFDCCHSGSGCDLQYAINHNSGRMQKSVNGLKSIVNKNIIMISGCQDSQTSADAYDNMSKRHVGAFTQTLLETLRGGDHSISLLPLYVRLCTNLRAYGFTQMPVLSSSVPSPNFQFSRANANGSLVANAVGGTSSASTSGKKDFTFNNLWSSKDVRKMLNSEGMIQEVQMKIFDNTIATSPSALSLKNRMSKLIN